MTAQWIPIENDEINQPKAEDIRGVELHVFLSPYDVPQGIRGFYDDDKDRFIVELKYLTDEKLVEEQSEESPEQHVSLLVGKNSGRLYKILIDVRTLEADSVELIVYEMVNEAITQLKSGKPNREKYFNAIDDVFSNKMPELLGDLRKHLTEA